MNVEKVREDFPILKRTIHDKPLVYLDNAASTQKPKQVIDAVENYYKEHNANIHRAIHQLSQEATALYDKAHEKTAEFMGAESMQEIIFTKNATEGLNLAAYSLMNNLEKGDEVVVTPLEHHSNLVPWQQLAKKKGVVLRYLSITDDQQIDMNSVNEIINPKTKIVAVTHVSNALGTINDIQQITKRAHEHDALCVVDGAQSIPHLPIDVKKLDVDFFAYSAHKMFGPTGIGVLYGKKELLESMTPFLYGGDMIKEVFLTKTTFNDLPWKFEAGTPNVAGAVGFTAALEYLQEIGMKNIEQYEQELTKHTLKRFKELPNVKLHGPREHRAAVFSFTLEGVHPHDVATVLDSEGIAVRSGHHCAMPLMNLLGVKGTCRASFHIYNTIQEADALIEGLQKASKVFGG